MGVFDRWKWSVREVLLYNPYYSSFTISIIVLVCLLLYYFAFYCIPTRHGWKKIDNIAGHPLWKIACSKFGQIKARNGLFTTLIRFVT